MTLTAAEREQLDHLIRSGRRSARTVNGHYQTVANPAKSEQLANGAKPVKPK